VGEGGGGEASIAVHKSDGVGGLIFDGVADFGGTQVNGEVVMAMPVGEGLGVGGDFDVEDADGFVFEGEVVVRLVGDFNYGGRGLRGEESGGKADERQVFHARDCSTE
jgi:hypothetical protein